MHPASLTRSQALTLSCAGLSALAVAIGIGRFVYTPILPFMIDDLGLTAGAAGFIASANYTGYLAGAVLAAAKLPGSRRAWLIGGLALSALTTAATGLPSDVMALAVLRLVGGLASAFVLIFGSAIILDRLTAGGRAAFSAVHFAGVGTGIAVSALLVTALATAGAGWRVHWFASGAVSVIGLAAILLLVTEDAPDPAGDNTPGNGAGLPALILAYGLFGFGYVITATFLVAIVRAEAPAQESVVWLVVGLSAAPSVAVWAWLGQRLGTIQAFALACLVEAVGVASSVLWLSGPGVIVAAALLGGTFMGITALGLIVARERTAGDPRRILAAMTASFGVGQIAGPIFAGELHDTLGSFTAPSLVAAAALVLAAALTARPQPLVRSA